MVQQVSTKVVKNYFSYLVLGGFIYFSTFVRMVKLFNV